MSVDLHELPPRMAAKITPNDTTGCWEWDGSRNRGGYGMVGFEGRWQGAHRVVYELLVGEIPPGLVIDHLCRVRHCVNPHHLRTVTTRANLLAPGSQSPAAVHANRTHCPAGHPYDEANTRITDTGRECRTCRRGWSLERMRALRARRRALRPSHAAPES